MKREEIEQAKKQAADIVNRQKRNIWDAKEYESEVFLEFAKLVEQATLERAAKEFEEDDEWRRGVYAGHAVSKIIRALKDTHD